MATISAPDATGEYSPVSPVDDYDEDEPDEEWKAERKEIIHIGFQDMIQEAKDRLERKLLSIQRLDVAEREQERAFLMDEFHAETAAIRALAKDEFEHALARERLQRRLRRDVPIRAPHHSPMQSLRLDLEQEQAATLKAANHDGDGDALSEAFQHLLDPLSDDEHPSLPTPVSDAAPELSKEKEKEAEEETAEHIGPGALMIKITRLPSERPPNSGSWVKASDAARKHELAVRQRANSKSEGRTAGTPAEPAKKWVSASDAAKRSSTQRRIAG
ncbi:hypothetical protein C8R46DRAFT_1073945 [Mycena filopes]|nr:hypothetical protein C8R46DRAFT_1073945 [Mycena filopes]